MLDTSREQRLMEIALVYVFPNLEPHQYVPAAQKFARSYAENPPGLTDHSLHVVINGDRVQANLDRIFSPLFPEYHYHNNWAKDLGAFIFLAHHLSKAELMVCMGAHVNFKRAGWLDRIVEAYRMRGPAVSAPWGSQYPVPHLRTTFFCCPPSFLMSYPDLQSEGERYQFEHGPNNFALWSRKLGFEPYQLTWHRCLFMKDWEPVSLAESLARDQHTRRDLGE
jgi:hypothetical protein